MNLATIVTIGSVIVFYIHIMFQLNTNDDLELYEIAFPSKEKLEEVCNFKQPVLFDYTEDTILECMQACKECSEFDVIVYDKKYKKSIVTLEKAYTLFDKNYAMYDNENFLKESLLKRHFENTDLLLRPPLVSTIHYDILMGSDQYTTRLQYKNYFRNYFFVSNGSVTIKLAPPRNTQFLNELKKYETQEYYSVLNPWKEKTKVKFLEIVVPKGKLLHIPAYWWYSIKLEKDACVCVFHYRTIMNVVAVLPELGLGLLQRQNTKVKVITRSCSASSDASHT